MFDLSYCAGLSCAKRETCARYTYNYPETMQRRMYSRPRTSWIMEPDPATSNICSAFIYLPTKGPM